MSQQPLTIGSDPEFLLVEVNPSTGQRLLPAYEVALNRIYSAQIGCDGASSTGEFRPKPATDPIKHFRNLKSLITVSRRRYLRDTWQRRFGRSSSLEMRAGSTGSMSSPLGGHIHFGVYPTEKILNGLDKYLSIPLLFIEQQPYNTRRRSSGRYGLLSSIRRNSHGFEYRTPASWIIEPEVALGVLTLAYTIVWEAIHHPENIKEASLPRSSFDSSNTEYFKSYLPDIFKEIRQMELYPKYKKPIEKLLKRAKEQRTWNETSDVWKNWIKPKILQRQVKLPKYHLFTFTADEYLSVISQRVDNPTTTHTPIKIFGLAEHRDFQASTNDPNILSILRMEFPHSSEQRSFFGVSTEVGFRKDLRSSEEGRRRIVKVLNQIARRIKETCVE